MAQIINTNVASLTAQRNLNTSQSALATSLQRLSSGLRINSAKDDAAGLAISDRLTAQIRGLNQAARNANDGISLAQTAEGGLQEAGNILQRMRELAIQSANDTNTASDRANLQKEVAALQAELNRMADTTTFNGKKILDGSFTAQKFQVGANANETISVSVGSARATAMGSQSIDSNTHVGAALAAAADLSAGNGVAGQTLTVNGKASAPVTVTAGDSAYEIAVSVNAATGTTGVSATARTSVTLSGVAAAGTVSFTLSSSTRAGGTQGSAMAISAAVTTTDLSGLADSINAVQGSTGITATLSADKASITLEQANGYDLNVLDSDNSGVVAGTVFQVGSTNIAKLSGNDSIVVGGQVSFSSNSAFVVATSAAGTVVGAASVTSTLSSVAAIDIGTQSGANAALNVLDQALSFISDSRASLGAVQNRLGSTIANLQNVSENVSAARSRILDADFAAETAALTRGQILQQAGIAILAQANALPQQVLSLLR